MSRMSQEQLKKINNTLTKVAAGVVTLQQDMKAVKVDVRRNRKNIETLLTNQDWMIGTLTRLDQERLSIIQTLRDYDERLERLEMKAGVAKS